MYHIGGVITRRRRVIQYSRDVCEIRRSRGALGRPVPSALGYAGPAAVLGRRSFSEYRKPDDDTDYVISRSPSLPTILSGTTLPTRSPAIATGR